MQMSWRIIVVVVLIYLSLQTSKGLCPSPMVTYAVEGGNVSLCWKISVDITQLTKFTIITVKKPVQLDFERISSADKHGRFFRNYPNRHNGLYVGKAKVYADIPAGNVVFQVTNYTSAMSNMYCVLYEMEVTDSIMDCTDGHPLFLRTYVPTTAATTVTTAAPTTNATETPRPTEVQTSKGLCPSPMVTYAVEGGNVSLCWKISVDITAELSKFTIVAMKKPVQLDLESVSSADKHGRFFRTYAHRHNGLYVGKAKVYADIPAGNVIFQVTNYTSAMSNMYCVLYEMEVTDSILDCTDGHPLFLRTYVPTTAATTVTTAAPTTNATETPRPTEVQTSKGLCPSPMVTYAVEGSNVSLCWKISVDITAELSKFTIVAMKKPVQLDLERVSSADKHGRFFRTYPSRHNGLYVGKAKVYADIPAGNVIFQVTNYTSAMSNMYCVLYEMEVTDSILDCTDGHPLFLRTYVPTTAATTVTTAAPTTNATETPRSTEVPTTAAPTTNATETPRPTKGRPEARTDESYLTPFIIVSCFLGALFIVLTITVLLPKVHKEHRKSFV